jgi:hypothetical protein
VSEETPEKSREDKWERRMRGSQMASESIGDAYGGAELRRAISRSRRRLGWRREKGAREEVLAYL